MSTSQTVTNGVRFSSLFTSGDVICHPVHNRRDSVIRDMVDLLIRNYGLKLDPAPVSSSLCAHEDAMQTTLAPGIFMPHVRIGEIHDLKVAVTTSREGIPYGPEGNSAHLIILALVPQDNPTAYLQALSSLSKVCGQPGIVDRIGHLETAEEVWKFFDRGGWVLPDFVCAGDIMEPVKVFLKDSDTLERAIDQFIRHNLFDLPVVDKDGDMVGVVTAHELMRVCMPDYILWMEDITPIINFEPFVQILRNAGKTSLSDIMSSEYAGVQVDSPAIWVAKEIVTQNVRRVFVLRGAALAGVVTLRSLLSKILRE